MKNKYKIINLTQQETIALAKYTYLVNRFNFILRELHKNQVELRTEYAAKYLINKLMLDNLFENIKEKYNLDRTLLVAQTSINSIAHELYIYN